MYQLVNVLVVFRSAAVAKEIVVSNSTKGHIGADTSTVNLVIGLILIAVLFLDRQLNIKGKEELKV